ncbi:MAG: hypothetical protein WC445_01300 [Patescibacteria group bacterium]
MKNRNGGASAPGGFVIYLKLNPGYGKPVMFKRRITNTSMAMICRPWITLRNGVRIYAKDHGKRAFCFYVDAKKRYVKKEPAEQTADSTAG